MRQHKRSALRRGRLDGGGIEPTLRKGGEGLGHPQGLSRSGFNGCANRQIQKRKAGPPGQCVLLLFRRFAAKHFAI